MIWMGYIYAMDEVHLCYGWGTSMLWMGYIYAMDEVHL